jgi:hypothetical protein
VPSSVAFTTCAWSGLGIKQRTTPTAARKTTERLNNIRSSLSGIFILDVQTSFSISQGAILRSSEPHCPEPFPTLQDGDLAPLAKSKAANSRRLNAFREHRCGPHILVNPVSLYHCPPAAQ